MRWLSRIGCGGLLVLFLAGCGEDKPTLAPVRGRVYYRGVPLAGGTIVFTPDADRGNHGPLALAEIQSDGSYSLRTSQEAGAVPGWHRVSFAAAALAAPALPRKYSDPERSGQSREVQSGVLNTFDFRLE
jgi:hypothetical protein